MKITTLHGEIGYSNNVEIIERALRERFGVNDNSHVATSVAAHIWSEVCGRSSPITWGTEEIANAVRAIKFRISQVEAVVAQLDTAAPAVVKL